MIGRMNILGGTRQCTPNRCRFWSDQVPPRSRGPRNPTVRQLPSWEEFDEDTAEEKKLPWRKKKEETLTIANCHGHICHWLSAFYLSSFPSLLCHPSFCWGVVEFGFRILSDRCWHLRFGIWRPQAGWIIFGTYMKMRDSRGENHRQFLWSLESTAEAVCWTPTVGHQNGSPHSRFDCISSMTSELWCVCKSHGYIRYDEA